MPLAAASRLLAGARRYCGSARAGERCSSLTPGRKRQHLLSPLRIFESAHRALSHGRSRVGARRRLAVDRSGARLALLPLPRTCRAMIGENRLRCSAGGRPSLNPGRCERVALLRVRHRRSISGVSELGALAKRRGARGRPACWTQGSPTRRRGHETGSGRVGSPVLARGRLFELPERRLDAGRLVIARLRGVRAGTCRRTVVLLAVAGRPLAFGDATELGWVGDGAGDQAGEVRELVSRGIARRFRRDGVQLAHGSDPHRGGRGDPLRSSDYGCASAPWALDWLIRSAGKRCPALAPQRRLLIWRCSRPPSVDVADRLARSPQRTLCWEGRARLACDDRR